MISLNSGYNQNIEVTGVRGKKNNKITNYFEEYMEP